MDKKNSKVIRSYYISPKSADIVSRTAKRLTHTDHAKSAVVEKMINFCNENIAPFEFWWHNQGKE